ncbi:universal stress protein [Saliphagus infecundisoli]|uniref:Universal stress protein n=1 Tax=Saliphagus infecundisoli TaxID=1849069 RepID=A0ABD5QEC6_9EURY|nr:universal stress protein [Saliphagus infecundisoli]
MPGDRPAVLVPVANPETAERLLDTAIDLARDRDLSILVLTVVEVPMQLPLERAREAMDVESEEAVVTSARGLAAEAGVPATGRLRFGRDVAGGVVSVAEREEVEAILVGWRGRPRRREIVLGSYIDEILSEALCDVLVKRIDRASDAVESILVPVAGGPHTEYAAEVAGSIAREHGARVELVTVVGDEDEERMAEARELLTQTSAALGAVESVEETVLVGDVVPEIVERGRERGHDVTVLGATRGGFLRRVLVGDVPEAIARESEGAVIMARRGRRVVALWKRLRNRLPV